MAVSPKPLSCQKGSPLKSKIFMQGFSTMKQRSLTQCLTCPISLWRFESLNSNMVKSIPVRYSFSLFRDRYQYSGGLYFEFDININILVACVSNSRSISIFWLSKFRVRYQYQYFGGLSFEFNININIQVSSISNSISISK